MIVIVGGGIAGLSAALLCETKGLDYTLISDNIGGRIFTKNLIVPNRILHHDMGAEYFLDNDTALMNLIDQLKLGKEEYLPSRAILNTTSGNFSILPTENDNFLQRIIKKFRMITYIGIKNIGSAHLVQNKLDHWYELIERLYLSMAHNELTDLYHFFEVELRELCQTTLQEYLISEGMSEDFIYKMVDPLFHAIYMLGADKLNAAIGVMGFAAKRSKVYKIKGGNSLVIQRLLDKIDKTKIVRSRVTEITKVDDGYNLHLRDGSSKNAEQVFIACSLQDISKLIFRNFSSSEMKKITEITQIEYNSKVFHHLITGVPKKSLQKLLKRKIDTIYLAEPEDIMEINLIHYQHGNLICDITSNRNFEKCNFDKYFSSLEQITSIHWNPAYPLYSPNTMSKFQNNHLIGHNLYLGTDSFISTMGSSVSIAQLVIKHFEKVSANKILTNTQISDNNPKRSISD